MKTNQEQTTQQTVKEIYEKPQIEIIEMEMEGSILQASDYKPGGGWGN